MLFETVNGQAKSLGKLNKRPMTVLFQEINMELHQVFVIKFQDIMLEQFQEIIIK